MKEHAVVRLTKDYGALPKGAQGTIVHKYRAHPRMVLVEFPNNDHALETFLEDDLEEVEENK